MKTILFSFMLVLTGAVSAQTVQFDYTLNGSSGLFTGTVTGSLAIDLDAGMVTKNHAEVTSGGVTKTTDFSGQHIDRIDLIDGVTMKYWDYNPDGSLFESVSTPSSMDAYVAVRYYEVGHVALSFYASGTGSVEDPTTASTFPCSAGFGTCHAADGIRGYGDITSLTVTYSGATSGVSAVPLPSSVIFILSGLMSIIGIGVRKRGCEV